MKTPGEGLPFRAGECLMQADFCAELLKELKRNQIHTAVDTCGFVSKEAIDKVAPYTDIFLYDVKAFDETVQINCTGQSNGIILDNLRYLDDCGKKIKIRIPYVPDYNSGEIEGIAKFLCQLKNVTNVKVLPYHNYAGSKYEALGMANTLPERLPEEDALKLASSIFMA